MIGIGINSALDALIQFVPVDEDAKEWLQRANDAASMAIDAGVGGGVSTAAIAAKMVAREMKDAVVAPGDESASRIFDAVSTVSQAAVGGAGSAASFGVRASLQGGGTVAQASLQKAAVKAAVEMGTKVGGGAAGAAVGYAANGDEGLQAGLQMGMAVGSGDVAQAARQGAGVAVGGAVAFAAEDGDAATRLRAAQVGASIGAKASALADGDAWSAEGLEAVAAGPGAALAAQSAGAAAKVAAGQDATDAFLESEGLGAVAAGQLAGVRGGDYGFEQAAQAARAVASEPARVVRAREAEREVALRDVIAKHGASEELLAKRDRLTETLGQLGHGIAAAASGAQLGTAIAKGVEYGTFDVCEQMMRDAEAQELDRRIAENEDLTWIA